MTPKDLDFWPKSGMKRYRCAATQEQLWKAWLGWEDVCAEHHGDTWYRILSGALVARGAPYQSSGNLADAMMQRARKAGYIKYRNGAWEKVE